jgi:cell division protein ftsL
MKLMMFILVLLILGVCYNGIQAAKFAHEQSNLVNEVQFLKKKRDQINAEWTQLLLEQKMLADDSVIDHAVRNGLDMHMPQATQVVYLD